MLDKGTVAEALAIIEKEINITVLTK